MAEHINQDQLAGLLAETSRINWKELQYFFANGTTICVSPELDLVQVAAQIAADNKNAVEQWMRDAQLAPVSSAQAKTWYDEDTTVWAVVVKPWILVQDK